MGLLSEKLYPNEYKYYDSPEGEDCLKKLGYVTKYCGIYGFMGSTIDVLLYSHPLGFTATAARMAYITLPLVGMGAAFVSATCIATNLRKKDDKLNYVIGAFATSAVFGAWRKSLRAGIYGGLFMAACAVLKKDFIENNWSMLTNDPNYVPMKHNFFTADIDFSLTKDPGRTWKHSHEVEK